VHVYCGICKASYAIDWSRQQQLLTIDQKALCRSPYVFLTAVLALVDRLPTTDFTAPGNVLRCIASSRCSRRQRAVVGVAVAVAVPELVVQMLSFRRHAYIYLHRERRAMTKQHWRGNDMAGTHIRSVTVCYVLPQCTYRSYDKFYSVDVRSCHGDELEKVIHFIRPTNDGQG